MTGKVILLVGASGGIGSQLATMFTQDSVILHYHNHAPQQSGDNVATDATDDESVQRMIDQILKKYGRIDVVVNASGTLTDGFAHKISPKDWARVIEINLIGAFNIIHAVLPSMRSNHYGRIINLSSVVFQRPVMGTSAYSASKAALVGLTRTVAIENASLGITCNCLSLGYFEAGLLYRIPPEPREEIRQAIPQKRFGRVDEIYRTIQYVIDTEYLTGQLISLNGGLYMD